MVLLSRQTSAAAVPSSSHYADFFRFLHSPRFLTHPVPHPHPERSGELQKVQEARPGLLTSHYGIDGIVLSFGISNNFFFLRASRPNLQQPPAPTVVPLRPSSFSLFFHFFVFFFFFLFLVVLFLFHFFSYFFFVHLFPTAQTPRVWTSTMPGAVGNPTL